MVSLIYFFNYFKARGDSPNIKPGELSWSFVSTTTKKKIIADCGELLSLKYIFV